MQQPQLGVAVTFTSSGTGAEGLNIGMCKSITWYNQFTTSLASMHAQFCCEDASLQSCALPTP